jgi:AraC-like DNA-binding protein
MFATPEALDPPRARACHLRKAAPAPHARGAGTTAARSELWLPRPALAACVRGVMARDTRGASLAAAQRYNHFPAAPTCALLWYLSGECDLLHPPLPASEPAVPRRLPAISLCGPFTRPTVSWNPGDMHAFMVLLMPDALQLMTGLDIGALVDRVVPADQALDASWRALLEPVRTACDDEERVARLEAFLLPRWRQARPPGVWGSFRLADWSQSLAVRAARSALGRSLRQAERRIKRWSGQTQRRLQGLQRSEQAFLHVAATRSAQPPDWADVAVHTGYADQAHLCRETRRVTGFAPEALRRQMFTEESLWAYRLWALGVDEDWESPPSAPPPRKQHVPHPGP